MRGDISTMMGYRRPTKVAALQGNVASSRGYDRRYDK